MGGVLKYSMFRAARLLVPTWIFLAFYFLLRYAVAGDFSWKIAVKSFCFQQDGIGYVWIVWVYVVVAMLTVPFFMLHERLGRLYWLLYAGVYLAYELAVCFRIGVQNRLLIYTLYYIVPYGLLLSLGLFYWKLEKRNVRAVIGAAFCIFLGSAALLFYRTGAYVPTQRFKYPPRLYWLSYAVCVSYLLIPICGRYDGCRLFDNPVVRFVGRNTLWIYLWHIMFVGISAHISSAWPVRFAICVAGAVLVAFMQISVVALLERRFGEKAKSITRFFRG